MAEQAIRFSRGDLAVFALCFLIVTSLYIALWKEDENARQLEIFVQGKKQYVLDLFENRHLSVKGKQGESIIEVKDGKVRFLSSTCNTSFCIRSGWQQHGGDFVACLPNAVSLHLVGGSRLYDAINF